MTRLRLRALPQAVPPVNPDPLFKIVVASNLGKQAVCTANSCKKPIARGTLRFGTQRDFYGESSYGWRHLGCVTKQQVANMGKKGVTKLSDIDGAALLDSAGADDAAGAAALRQLFA